MKALRRHVQFVLCLLLLTLDQCSTRRGGILSGRGSSASRGGVFRTQTGSRSGGIFGSHGASHKTGTGTGWGRQTGVGTGWGRTGQHGRHSGTMGGWGSGSRVGRPKSSIFTKSNIGSFVAGAAAGYLTYKAGKALIRSAYSPMMWNNRPYYWGSNYYRGGHGTHMCRMPVDPNDPQLGNVYFEDGTRRPREIVWSCNFDEYCCGYDCCWRGRASSTWGFGLSTIVALLIGLCCIVAICIKLVGSASINQNMRKYMQGNRMTGQFIPEQTRQ